MCIDSMITMKDHLGMAMTKMITWITSNDHYDYLRSPWCGHDAPIMLPLLLPPHALACNQGALHQHQFHHHPCHDHHHPHLTKGHLAKTRILGPGSPVRFPPSSVRPATHHLLILETKTLRPTKAGHFFF